MEDNKETANQVNTVEDNGDNGMTKDTPTENGDTESRIETSVMVHATIYWF